MALSKTGRFLSKAEILGVGAFSPLPILGSVFGFLRFFFGPPDFFTDLVTGFYRLIFVGKSLGNVNLKSLLIAKNHPKPSQEVSERFGPFIHKMTGSCRNSPQKVHANFAQYSGRQIINS